MRVTLFVVIVLLAAGCGGGSDVGPLALRIDDTGTRQLDLPGETVAAVTDATIVPHP